MNNRGFLINLACTGVIPTKSMTPNVPISHEEILDDVGECIEMGVQMFHLHTRDTDGKQASNPEPYGRLIEAIRSLPGGREAILCATTSGRIDSTLKTRARVLDLDGDMKPDMASLTLSSHNFINGSSINTPDTVRSLAEKMRANDIRPELEIFDLGMANFAQVLIKEGLAPSPSYANMILGNIAGAQTELLSTGALLSNLPTSCTLAIGGLGRYQLQANLLGLMYADGVRTGLEDNIWFDQARQTKASNQSLVKRILRMAAELERPLLPRADLRTLLEMNQSNEPHIRPIAKLG